MKKRISTERISSRQRYATRKLKVGLVSLLIGFTFVFAPATSVIPPIQSFAQEEIKEQTPALVNMLLTEYSDFTSLKDEEKDNLIKAIIDKYQIADKLEKDTTSTQGKETYRDSLSIQGNIATLKLKDGKRFKVTLVTKAADVAGKVQVADPEHLTDKDVEAVKAKVLELNPGAKDITVHEDGIVTFKDSQFNLKGYALSGLVEKEVTEIKDSKTAGELHDFIDGKIMRVAGDNRAGTAAQVSRMVYPNGADAVIIANGEMFSDVLSAMPYGKRIKAPVLYVKENVIPKNTKIELKRLRARRLIIIGGDNTISRNVERIFEREGFAIERLAGSSRYQTSAMIAQNMRKLAMDGKKDIIVASGETFPDALSISPIAMRDEMPILLTSKNHISKFTKAALNNLSEGKIYIAGGENTISPMIESELGQYAKNGVERLAGQNRYETSKIITEKMNPNATLGVYASGEMFPDAMVASELAEHYKAPIMLVQQNSVPDSISTYLKSSKIIKGLLVGGKNTISDSVKDNL